MCRLLAIIPKDNKRIINDALLEFQKLAECGYVPQGKPRGHQDGWGIATIKNSQLTGLEKQTGSALANQKFSEFIKSDVATKADVIVAHLRKASVGGISINNTHPFVYKNFIFGHNGSIFNNHQISLGPKFASLVRGETDSERFFLFLMEALEEGKSLEQAIDFIKANFDYRSINFILSDGQTLWALRAAKVDLDYYTLYQGEEPKTKAIIICSEKLPLANIDWRGLANNQLQKIKFDFFNQT